MPFEAVDEAMDYLYFMQEVTNAYSTELTWALALVLGLTCLYIWRALGLQEAERLHSRMVSSRPVFSSFPSPTTTTPSSVFTAAYKNRFAHKDRSRVEERERVNAIGYDILHTYNNSAPYPRHRMVSRKRNGSGLVNGSERSGPGLQRGVWDSDLSAGGSGTFPSLVSTPRCRPATRSLVMHRVPVSSNRQENMDAKDMQAAQHHPYSYTGNHYNYYQKTQQHLNIDKIHQQIKEHQQQKPFLPTFDELVKDEPGTLRHPVSNLPLRYRTPSPGIRKVYPVPAPREKTPPSNKPRIESLFSELARHTNRRGDNESVKDVEGEEKDLVTATNRKDNPTVDVTVATDVSAKYKNVVKSLSPIDRILKKNSRSSDQESPPGRSGHEKTPGETEKNRQSKERRQTSNERSVDSSEMNSTIEQGALPQKRTRSNKTCTIVDKEIMERLRRELLMSKDDETSRYKLASTFLSEFAKSQPVRRPRHVHRESEQPSDLKHWDTPDTKRSKTKHLTKKTSDTGVCKKRSKTTQKTVCKGPKHLMEEDSVVIKNKFDTVRDDEPYYDSAVLRAIRADEEIEKAEKLAVEANDVSKTTGIMDERGESPKNTAGDTELGRTTATREAGRRLAKLRKRLEDSLEHIQRQSGSDRDLADKSRTSKLRKRREELERLTFMKEDILELETLTIRTSMSKEVTSGSSSNPQPNTVTPAAEKVSTSHPVRSSVLEKEEESDGGSNFPTRHNSIRITKFNGTCSCAKGPERRENNVTKIIANFTKTSKEDNRTDRVCTSAKHEINTNRLESSQRLLETVAADNENTTASKPDIQSHKKEKEISAYLNKDSFDKSATTDENISPRKFGKPTAEGQKHEKFMTRSGKILDEESLEGILEHQSKLREALKQRKKSPHIMHDPKKVIVTLGEGTTAMEKSESPSVSPPIEKSPAHATDKSKFSKQQSSQEKGKASTEEPKIEAARLSPIVLDGTHFHNESKTDEDAMGQVLSPSSEEKLPEDGGTENSLCVSTTTFSHLGYKEPEVQQTQPSSAPLLATSPEKLWAPGFDPLLAGERENYARRRVRWRRHAERMERQRVEAEAELHKVPPPVLPKQTRLNDIVDNNAGQQNIDAAPVPSEQSNQESKFSDSQGPPEGKPVDTLHIEGLDNTVSSYIHSSEIHTNDAEKPLVSPIPVRRSNLSTVKEKNTSLAAGETGLVKGPPENVEICEEKALSPSKAASVFDPKAQLEREKEKVEAERATRNTKEGMNPSQFKANMHLFEQAAVAEGAKPLSPECKVKANVKMFEEVSRNERT